MQKKWAMFGIMASAALQGLGAAYIAYAGENPVAWVGIAICIFLAGFFPFAWLHQDRKQHGLRRSYWFDVGVVALGVIVIPLYLWRSRQRGERLLTQLAMFGTVFASTAVSLGSTLAALVIFAILFGLPKS